MSLMSMGEDAGEVVGTIAAGFVWTTWGIPMMLGARALLALGTELYAIVLSHSLEKQEDHAIRGGRRARVLVLPIDRTSS
jgi:hypothetical protein